MAEDVHGICLKNHLRTSHYLAVIPLVNLIILIYLPLKKTARDADEGADIPGSNESQETRL